MESAKLLESEVVSRVLNLDASLDVLLTRLKQSVTTGEELAKFVKKKAQIEDEHYTQLKKFAGNTRMLLKNATATNKIKKDLFLARMDQIIEYDELVYQIGLLYVKALNTMYDEMAALIGTIVRLRKMIKDDGKRREKECADAVLAAEKAKQKYFHLCEDLEKLRSTDHSKLKTFLLKNKTVEQQEDDLQRKVDLADQDYKLKVAACKRAKDEILMIHRPTNSKKLKNLILEMDIAMNVQLQKYATWNENLIMNSGVLVCPLPGGNKPSMKDVASTIDNERDLYTYLAKFDKAPANRLLQPVEYVVHPSLRLLQPPQKPFLHNKAGGAAGAAAGGVAAGAATASVATAGVATTGVATEPDNEPAAGSAGGAGASGSASGSASGYSLLDPLNGPKALSSLPTQPTFGISIEQLIQFAGVDNVPLVVKKCIDTIETYGLDIEGVYRALGNVNAVLQLKDLIDYKFTNYLLIGAQIDPDNVLDTDVYTVALLLKLYFLLLPEPLLTQEYYRQFIETVKLPDEGYIAKKLHHLVFNLPDGAYFTLRALIFHLNKVAAHEEHNRMSAKNLAIIWGPALMNDDLMAPQDLSYKSKVVEELMAIANEIFEAD